MNKEQSIQLIESMQKKTNAKSQALAWLNDLERLYRLDGQKQVDLYIKLSNNYEKFKKDALIAQNPGSKHNLSKAFGQTDRYFSSDPSTLHGRTVMKHLDANQLPKRFIKQPKHLKKILKDTLIKAIKFGT